MVTRALFSPLKKLLAFILLVHAPYADASPLFDDNTVLEVELTGPLSSLFDEKTGKTELPFTLRADGAEHSIKVRLRGKSRRRVCSFPPLRLNFSVDRAAQSIFADQDKLKLVAHCRADKSAQVDALEEYVAYRIFNLISDVSYRVRLFHITYTDTDGRLKQTTFDRYGFVIESASALADRVGGLPAHVPGVSLRSLDSEQAATVFIFQYLIGNTDWSLVTADGAESCCHNGDLIDIGSMRHYVPYDFDLSGLVNARYARPDPSLGISRVTHRRYRGFCMPREELQGALSNIMARRVDIAEVVNQVPGVSPKDIKVMTKYIGKFFDRARNTEKLLKSFERRCL